ncbi:MAG TPA: UDP-N-acetylglucosamine 2-epimerase (non-hydrolyzing) [Ktedonobacteraceae bacterium]|nr:UDP-N-acetylglucosamine 2-epimerase (non-hydrolyzing) [Ktedonobacteraceae bacterium]
MRFASIVGARPQFIKLAPLSHALRRNHQEILIHTGQHYDYSMSALFFDELEIPVPDYNLEIGSGLHGEQTGRMLAAIEQVLVKERPDWVIVFGDTNSTLAGALAAAKLHMPIAHVEAGLRSFNRAMPEEINRIVTDHLAQRHFCPTETACHHLYNEGIMQHVEMVGDVMYDALLLARPKLRERATRLLASWGIAARGDGGYEPYALVTVHRPVNTDDAAAMAGIARALNRLDMPVIFPVHPRTRHLLQRYDIAWERHIRLVEPQGYLDMLALEHAAFRILTDSGGVQKEAFLLRVPCITLREETEWTETVELGWNTLSGSRSQAILDAFYRPEPQPAQRNPFGEGDAGERIAQSFNKE